MSSHCTYTHLSRGLLRHSFDEVSPDEFYRDIFGSGELDEENAFTPHKYVGVAVEVTGKKKKNGKYLVRRYTITDDLNTIDELQYSSNFCIVAPISYAGKTRKSEFARFMYALCIEVDELRQTKTNEWQGLDDLIHQCKNNRIPTPTYIVSSGNGIHLYYVFKKPIPLFKNVVNSLVKYKRVMTKKIWNKYITDLYREKDIQYESVFQAFRMVGSLTKNGILEQQENPRPDYHYNTENIVRAFKFDDANKVSIEYMNSFVEGMDCDIVTIYKSDLTRTRAKELYPEWYEKRIVNKETKGSWSCKRAVYDWWKNRILSEGAVGHRYYCLMCLVIYAVKCKENITYEELENDCFEIMEYFDTLTTDPENRFTEKDVMDALQVYEDKGYITYPINSISNRSGIHIEKNKRNYKKQRDHLKIARAIRNAKTEIAGKENWYDGGGRPKGSSRQRIIVREWKAANPNGRKVDCIRETGLSKPTVYRWWEDKE